MNTEIQKNYLVDDGHPDENLLLLALERELSSEEAEQVEQHLGNCWSCRARSNEMQQGILAFVEYREKRYLPSLETPPYNLQRFPAKLRAIAEQNKPIGRPLRVWRSLRRLMTTPSQIKWAGATAILMVVVVVWTQVFINAPTLSASELLTRASAAQNPINAREKDGIRRTAHQKVRITSGEATVVRDFEWAVGDPIAQARWDVRPEASTWNTPLTAAGFARWRDSLSEKEDEVNRSGDRWTLKTTAIGDVVKEGRLVVRADDFHPVEQHIRFADDRQLDLQELAFEIKTDEPAPQSVASSTMPETVPPKQAEVALVPNADLDEAELQLRYVMFSNQWDLGEDLAISRTVSSVTVSGIASSIDRAMSMEATLGNLPNVQVSIVGPGIGNTSPSNLSARAESNSTPLMPLLKEVLDRAFPTSESRREFVDNTLGASDDVLSHAWALKKLVDRYTELEERLLKPESQAKLDEMVRAHLQQLGHANAVLDPLVELLPSSRTRRIQVPGEWRSIVLAVFAHVQEQDSLIASLVAGTQGNGQDLAGVAEKVRAAHQAIGTLLGELKNFKIGRG